MALIDEGAKKRTERPRDIPKVSPDLEVLLTPEDMEVVRERARKAAQASKKKEAEDQYYKQALEEELRALEPEKELRDIVLDLPPFAHAVMLDGKQYFHGHKYEVTRQVYDLLGEIVARGWAHDAEVGHPNAKFYERPSHLGIGNYASVHPPMRNEQLSPQNADVMVNSHRRQMRG